MERAFHLEACLCVWLRWGAPVGGHVVCARRLLEFFECVYVALWEVEVYYGLDENSVIHASECSLEVGVGCVYGFFTSWRLRTR